MGRRRGWKCKQRCTAHVVFLPNGGFIAGHARRQLVRAAEANIAALETPLLTSELHQLVLVEPLLELVDLDPILLKVVPLAPQSEEVVNLGDVRRREHEALLDRPGTDRHLIAYLTPPVHHPGHHASAQVRVTHANVLGPLAPLLLPLVGARVCALVVVGVGATKIAVLTIAALTIAALTRLTRTSQTTILWCQQGGAKGDAQRLTLFSRVVVRQNLFVHGTLAHGVPHAGVAIIPEDERSVALANRLARLRAINFDIFPGQYRDGIVHDFPSNTRFRDKCVPNHLENERAAVGREPAIHDHRWSWRLHRGSLARAHHVETRHANGSNHALVARSAERAIAPTKLVRTRRGIVTIVSPFHPNYRSQSLVNKKGLRFLRCGRAAARVQVTPHHGVADGMTPPQGSGEEVVQSGNLTVGGGRHEVVRNTAAVVRRRIPIGTAGAAVVGVASGCGKELHRPRRSERRAW